MRHIHIPIALLLTAFLAACGGGGGGGASPSSPVAATTASAASLLAPAAATSAGDASRIGPGTGATAAVRGHFDRVNEVRMAMGLAAFDWNDNLATAAQRHADYQRQNQLVSHSESLGKPGFSGEGFGARASAAGYSGQLVSEVIIGGQPDTAQDGRNLMDAMLTAPGHRFVLLSYEFSEIGIGSSPLTTNLGTRISRNAPADGVLLYPFHGQRDLPLGYAPSSEMPNPLPGVATTGMPLSVHGGMFSSFTVVRVSLQNNTTNLPHALHPCDSMGSARSAFVFFPRDSLAADSSYTFTVDLQINGRLHQVRSVFTTAKA